MHRAGAGFSHRPIKHLLVLHQVTVGKCPCGTKNIHDGDIGEAGLLINLSLEDGVVTLLVDLVDGKLLSGIDGLTLRGRHNVVADKRLAGLGVDAVVVQEAAKDDGKDTDKDGGFLLREFWLV